MKLRATHIFTWDHLTTLGFIKHIKEDKHNVERVYDYWVRRKCGDGG